VHLQGFKPATHQTLVVGDYKWRMSDYWNERNSTLDAAAVAGAAPSRAVKQPFLATVDRSHLLGVPSAKTRSRACACAVCACACAV
jgi:hypothetical protein